MKLPFLKSIELGRLEILPPLAFLILFVLTAVFYSKTAKAQIPPPTVPCDETRSEEFHSLRPYQASPCNPNAQELALFCGNDLVLQDSITVSRGQARYCQNISPTEEECFFSVTKDLDIAIDVSGAEFPIMGNTEGIDNNVGIINSQDQTTPEQIDDAKKVNEYVSWFLNGLIGRAEYDPPEPNTEEGITRITTFSGPIKKLLSWESQIEARIRQVQNLPQQTIRHDQIIGCRNGENPAACYPAGAAVLRLSYWLGRLPPLRNTFPIFRLFWDAYRAWRGNTFDRLFSYVPFSSTEDRLGLVEVVDPVIQPTSPNMTITINSLTTSPANLFFAHQEESRTLADILQSTFVPKDEPKSGPVSQVSPAEYCDLTQVRSNPGDDLFAGEIRVLANYTADFSCGFEIPGSSRSASPLCYLRSGGEADCVPDNWSCNPSMGSLDCDNVYGSGFKCGVNCRPPSQSCTKTASVILNTVTETPVTDDIWSRLVAGPMAVFKRIFPRVEVGAPIEGILDIPAATGVSFSATLNGDPAPLYAGNPSNQRSALELYFPHVGGIHEYFLKCIQQALRPQGFGEGCLSGAPGTQAAQVNCDPNVPDSAIPSTYRGGFKANYLSMANRWTAGCTGADNTLADECYNDTVKQASEAGVNPAFALTIWLNESGASNYCIGPTVRDFGINDPSIFQNWGEQLSRFLVLPFSGTYSSCSSQPGWPTDMHAFLSVFSRGGCSPGDENYYNDLVPVWGMVAGNACISGGQFSIDWPTDNSCP